MARLDGTGEVVMATEIPVVAALDKPGATAGAAGHIAGNGDDGAASEIPELAGGTLTHLPRLSIEGMGCRVAIGIVGLIDGLVIGPARAADHVGQFPLVVGRNDRHAIIVVQFVGLPANPVGGNFQVARRPAAVGRFAAIIQRAEEDVAHPAAIPVEAVTGSVHHTVIAADNGGARADHILPGGAGQEELANGRKRILSVAVARRLSLLLSCLALTDVATRLYAGTPVPLQDIIVHGRTHPGRCPVIENVG